MEKKRKEFALPRLVSYGRLEELTLQLLPDSDRDLDCLLPSWMTASISRS